MYPSKEAIEAFMVHPLVSESAGYFVIPKENARAALKAAYAIDFAALQQQLALYKMFWDGLLDGEEDLTEENVKFWIADYKHASEKLGSVMALEQLLAEKETEIEALKERYYCPDCGYSGAVPEHIHAGVEAVASVDKMLDDARAQLTTALAQDSLRNKALNSSAKDVGQMLEDLDQQNAKLQAEIEPLRASRHKYGDLLIAANRTIIEHNLQLASLQADLAEAGGLLMDAVYWCPIDTVTGQKGRAYLARRKGK